MKLALLITDDRENNRRYDLPAPFFGTAPEALLQGLATLPELEVHVLSCTQRPVAAPAKLADNIFFHSLLVPKLGWLRTGYQGCIRAVRRKLRALRPDLVHGQGTERDCAISAALSGFPSVVTIHGNLAALARLLRPRPFSYLWLAARVEDFTLPRAGGVFCNSAYTEELARPRARRIWRVANALRGAFFALSPAAPQTGRPVLLNVGVISPRKRQVELLELGRRLRAQGLDFELHFIGSLSGDAYSATFRERLRPAEAEGWARHLGTLDTAALIRRFDTAAALVHFPSEEAFGLAVAEALAREVRLFGAQVGGVTEIAAGAPGAELFAAGDWSGLETALAGWLRSGAPRAAGAGAVMRARYHPEVIALRHLEIYREFLSTAS